LSLLQAQLHVTKIQGLQDRTFLTELVAKLKLNKNEQIIVSLHLASVKARSNVVVKELSYNDTSQKVMGSRPEEVNELIFSIHLILPAALALLSL
jgi:hypothetical protein